MALSYGIAAGCLYWVFHGIPLRALLHSFEGVNWGWIAPAVGLDLAVYFLAGWEWQLLLRSVGRLRLVQTVQAIFAGRLANDLLPVHVGYVIRLYLASRWTNRSIASVVPSLLVERFFDSLWLALGIGLTVLFFPLPARFVRTGETLGVGIVIGVLAVAGIVLRRQKCADGSCRPILGPWKVSRKIGEFVGKVADGMRSIARSILLAAAGISVLKLTAFVLAFLMLVRAYGFEFSIWTFLAVFVVAYTGFSIPSTPASVGVFQLFCVAGLRFFGVSRPEASSFALLAFVVLNAPLSVGGCVALAQSGLSWRQIRQRLRSSHDLRPREDS
jgi:glycosyltransferase 2 family protein